jgi:hypothetical protein
LRESEERLKSDLRTKEAEISTLRDGIISGRAHRQAAIDRRRLEAVERIWRRVSTTLVPYKSAVLWMKIFNLNAVAKMTPKDDGFRKVFEIVSTHIPEDDTKVNDVSAERIFISPLAWAYFSAYQAIMYVSYAQVRVLAAGIKVTSDFFDFKEVDRVLKAALPHHASYIDQHSSATYQYLLDELEESIIKELTTMLEGHQYDQAEIQHSKEIMREVNKANTATESASAGTPAI